MNGAPIAVVEKTTTDVLKLKELDGTVVKFHCGDREWECFGGRAHGDFLACLHRVAINWTVTLGLVLVGSVSVWQGLHDSELPCRLPPSLAKGLHWGRIGCSLDVTPFVNGFEDCR